MDDPPPPRDWPVVPGLTPSEPMTSGPIESMLTIGWREWVGLPGLRVRRIKAKIDTGARSSSIHAFDMETYVDAGIERVRFSIHPMQFRDSPIIQADVPILERRQIRSSNGESSERIVIRTHLEIQRRRVLVDLTLANRDAMGFRMLVGREAIRNRFLVHPGASYLAGNRRKRKPPRERENP